MAKLGTSKRGGKQWQTTPKNLPRMQCVRAIPVAWLSSGLCPDRPKGRIPIIIIRNKKYLTINVYKCVYTRLLLRNRIASVKYNTVLLNTVFNDELLRLFSFFSLGAIVP